jgi:hypothetical protein
VTPKRFPNALMATMLLAAMNGGGQIRPDHMAAIEPLSEPPKGPSRHDLERIKAARLKRERKAARKNKSPHP